MKQEPKYPIYEIIDGKKKFIWRNLFRVSIKDALLIGLIIFLALGYKYDTAQCREVLYNPCDYIEQFNCFNESYNPYEYIQSPYSFPNLTILPENETERP